MYIAHIPFDIRDFHDDRVAAGKSLHEWNVRTATANIYRESVFSVLIRCESNLFRPPFPPPDTEAGCKI